MKARLWVYTGDRPSNGAKNLAAQEGFLRLRQHHMFKVKPNDVVINWGITKNLKSCAPTLNSPESVGDASNKSIAFTMMSISGVRCVEWTALKCIAEVWLQEDSTVVVRKKLTGHSGDGIVILEKGFKIENVPEAPLYTRYVHKVKEFRVHVVNGKVIDTQQKIKDPDREVVSWKVRSHENGFIFARNGIVHSEDRDNLAINACKALGLDFGAVDIVQDKKGVLYVLEVNTAPGLEGQTVKNYAEAFRTYL